MLKIIKKWWEEHKASTARQKFLSSPIGYETANSILEILNTDDTYVGKYLSQERKTYLFNDIMSHAFVIAHSKNPIIECRNFICNNIDIMTCFKILTIKPSPNKDYSGCRGLPGITGELFGHLPEIVKKDEALQLYVYTLDDVTDELKENPDYLYEVCLKKAAEAEIYINAGNMLRIHFNDYKDGSGGDWLRKYVEIQLALYEFKYRKSIGLIDVLSKDSPLGSRALQSYTVFRSLIMGKDDPEIVWQDVCNKKIEADPCTAAMFLVSLIEDKEMPFIKPSDIELADDLNVTICCAVYAYLIYLYLALLKDTFNEEVSKNVREYIILTLNEINDSSDDFNRVGDELAKLIIKVENFIITKHTCYENRQIPEFGTPDMVFLAVGILNSFDTSPYCIKSWDGTEMNSDDFIARCDRNSVLILTEYLRDARKNALDMFSPFIAMLELKNDG